MYIPMPSSSAFAAASPYLALYTTDGVLRSGFGGGKLTPEGRSSLIGIVTAIVGNVLISFALNTQRYAHLRLSKDREQAEEARTSARKKRRKIAGYGTQQAEIAEQRAQENARHGPANGKMVLEEDEHEAGESEPLIPHLDARRSDDFADGSSLEAGASEKDDGDSKNKNYLKSPIWWLGISLMVIGEAGNFLAYGFAPASVVSPLGVVALVSNCLIAPLLLHERFRWRDGVGVLIAVAGCVTVVLSASGSDPKLDPDTIWDLITTWEFETYLGVTVLLIILLTVASNKFGEKSILIDLGLVGLFGGYTALATKGVASLLSNTIWRVVTFPITYVLLAVLIFTAVMQIKYVNRALQRFNSTMVIPTQFVLFTLSVIIGSSILYRDFERRSAQDAGKFVGGCLLTFVGVWCITSGRSNDDDHDEQSGDDEEELIDLLDAEGVQPEIRERNDHDLRQTSLVASKSSSKTAPAAISRSRTSDNLPPTLLVTPDFGPSTPPQNAKMPSEPYALTLGPADRSAIHAGSISVLPGSAPKPPRMHATTSAPTVPTLSPTKRPQTPYQLSRNTTSPASPAAPRTPAPKDRQTNLDPNTSPQRLLNRHSIVGLLPDLGPLTSPLSSSLSAVVADSLRRGDAGKIRRRSTLRPGPRRRTGTGSYRLDGSAPDGVEPRKRHSIASGTLEFDDQDGAGEGFEGDGVGALRDGVGSPRNRARSMSATLADLFTGTGKRADGETSGR